MAKNNNEDTQPTKLYPNTDASVWLRSCEEEIVKPKRGCQTGKIPLWLRGSLLRNGPGSIKVGDMEFKHLFDSSALLHRFAIESGEVTYQCRFLRSKAWQLNRSAKRIVVTEFGTKAVPDPCHSIFDRVSTMFKPGEGMSDNAMISVYPFGDEFYTFTESPIIHRINPETLETTGRINVADNISIINHTSHPHVLPNGDVYNLGMAASKKGPVYTVVHFPNVKDGNMFDSACRVANIPVRWPLHPGYMHTFGITDNYFIIVEQPLSVSLCKFVKTQLANDPYISCLKWYPKHKTLFHVVKRSDGEIFKTFQADPFFYLHIVNQYEQDGKVIIDICSYKDAAMLQCMYVESMKEMQTNPDYARMFRGRPVRYVLPLEDSGNPKKGPQTVVPEQLCSLGCETPRINYDKYLGRPYQYFYAISSDVDAEIPGALIKVDTKNKTKITWQENNCYPSEPIFVPSPGSKEEDDGVIIAAMVWGGNRENEVGLLVLDAKNLQELGRATFVTPSPAPKCLHGWFHPSSKSPDIMMSNMNNY